MWGPNLDGAKVNSGVAEIPIAGNLFQAERSAAAEDAARSGLRAYFAGPENRLAPVAVAGLLSGETAWLGPLWLYGPAGAGKTHLARGIARHFYRQQTGSVVYVSGLEFARQFAAAIEADAMAEFRTQFREADLLVLDEIGPLAKKPSALVEFRFALDAVSDRGGLVIVSSRREPRQLRALPSDVAARLTGGLVLKLALPGVAARTAIVAEIASLRGIDLAAEVVHQLAAQLSGNPRDLLAALTEIAAQQADAGRHTIDAAAVRKYFSQQPARPPRSPASIIGIVARHFELDPAQLKSAARTKGVVAARSMAMYLIRKLTDCSLDRIGRALGGRDHTTVLHNCRKIQQQVASDTEVRQAVDLLTQRLQTD